MIKISEEKNFYQQEYCGCAYSLRDTNKWRRQNQRPAVVIGEKFYGTSPLNSATKIVSSDKNKDKEG